MSRFFLIPPALLVAARFVSAQSEITSEIAFSRITHGWTNYSTAFNATHDTGASADYASVGALFTPATDITVLDFAAILIWSETRTPDFSRFQFRVCLWSSLDAFIQEPRLGDIATWNFAAPTGGSSTVRDATTRGGRPAYELRFSLTNAPTTLSNNRTYVVGFAARTDTQANGELFVPTSHHEGPSDLQAGDLVVGGWQYLANAGGSTIYSGQLAVELVVAPRRDPPKLQVARTGNSIRLSWPSSAADLALEYSLDLTPGIGWLTVEVDPFEEDGQFHVILPVRFSRQWFRLRQ